jgi:hypothetical protein
MSYRTDALLKASRQAANIAIGADQLLTHLFNANLLGPGGYQAARTYCDALTAKSKAADAALLEQYDAERDACHETLPTLQHQAA